MVVVAKGLERVLKGLRVCFVDLVKRLRNGLESEEEEQ